MGRYVASESINVIYFRYLSFYMWCSEKDEQRTLNQRVQGSSPCAPTTYPYPPKCKTRSQSRILMRRITTRGRNALVFLFLNAH